MLNSNLKGRMEKITDKHYSRSEAADLLQIHRGTLMRWEREGKIKSFKHPVSGWVFYKKKDIDKLAKKLMKGLDEIQL